MHPARARPAAHQEIECAQDARVQQADALGGVAGQPGIDETPAYVEPGPRAERFDVGAEGQPLLVRIRAFEKLPGPFEIAAANRGRRAVQQPADGRVMRGRLDSGIRRGEFRRELLPAGEHVVEAAVPLLTDGQGAVDALDDVRRRPGVALDRATSRCIASTKSLACVPIRAARIRLKLSSASESESPGTASAATLGNNMSSTAKSASEAFSRFTSRGAAGAAVPIHPRAFSMASA